MSDTATAVPAGKIQPRLKQKYKTEIVKALTEENGYTNPHQVPGLVKIVVNMGVGEARAMARSSTARSRTSPSSRVRSRRSRRPASRSPSSSSARASPSAPT